MKTRSKFLWVGITILLYLTGDVLSDQCENCQYCVRVQNYHVLPFTDTKCIVCQSDYVSVNGNCIIKDFIPNSLKVKDCFYYDYNFDCLNCNVTYHFEDDYYSECKKYGRKYQGKTDVGRIFYLYIVPIVCGIALIVGGVFLFFYLLKKQKEKKNSMNSSKEKKGDTKPKPEEQKLQTDHCCKNGKYKLNCSKHHMICIEHSGELKEFIIESKMDEIESKCPICNEKVTLVQLIDKCEKCNTVKEVSQKYCEGKCKFCASCFNMFYPKSTTCPNGHKLLS